MILYELGSRGKAPFCGMGDIQIWRHLDQRITPDMAEIKPYFTDKLKNLMLKCWGYEPRSRPKAVNIIKMLQSSAAVIHQVEEVSMGTSDRIGLLETKLVEITGVVDDQHTQNQSTNEINWINLQEHDRGVESLMKELSIMAKLYTETPVQPKVLDSVNSLLKNALGPNGGKLFHRILLKLVTKGAGVYVEGPIKQKDRCISKVDNDYEGNSSRLVDILRGTATFDSCGKMKAFLDFVKSSINIRIIRCKDRINSPGPSKYRDVLMNIIVLDDDSEAKVFQVGELQLHLKYMYKLKKADHRTYDINRIIPADMRDDEPEV